ncbi:MAG TPA: hypothetical protein VLI68_14840, partial [Hanamia sp.]|nr:hypothetical protein [Hanamia sp.]
SGDKLNDGASVLAGTITVAAFTFHNSEVEIKGIEYKDFKLYKNAIGENNPKFRFFDKCSS